MLNSSETRGDGISTSSADRLAGTNALLEGISASERAIIDPFLQEVPVSSREMIAEAGTALEWVHFPTTCVISIVTVVNGGGIEALTVGREGVTGFSLMNGSPTTFGRVIGQIPGYALRIESAEFCRLLPALPELKKRVYLYSQLAFDATSQSAACNRLHVTEERCARWLLMSQDRAARDEFELTQTFLAQMLGVRRPAVTVAIGIMEKAGLISHRRGRIRITDRKRLEAAACECYGLIRDRATELLEL